MSAQIDRLRRVLAAAPEPWETEHSAFADGRCMTLLEPEGEATALAVRTLGALRGELLAVVEAVAAYQKNNSHDWTLSRVENALDALDAAIAAALPEEP